MRIFRYFVVAAACLVAVVPAFAETTLRVGLSALPLSLGNPYRTSAIPTILTTSAIFDALTRFDEEGNLLPWLATSWEAVDEQTWRFRLREGVTFSNGKAFTSAAVVNAVEYLTGDESVDEGVRRELPFLKGARAVDDLTVEITTTVPVPVLPRYVTSLHIAEPEAFNTLGPVAFSEQPVGTGPFKLDRWTVTTAYLSAFKQSWRPPKVDKLEISALPENSSRAQGVQSGRIDIALGIGPDELEAIELNGGKRIVAENGEIAGLSFFATRDNPFSDVRVRRAMSYAIDRQAMIDALFGGEYTLASQPIPSYVFGYNPDLEPVPYDPERAKALFKEAGYPDGFTFTFESAIGGAANDALIFQQLQADLAKVGVEMIIKIIPIPQLLRKLARSEFDGEAFIMPWPAWPSLDAMRPMQLHSCQRRVPWFCDQNIMPKIEAAMVEWDEAESLRLRQEIMADYQDAAPAVFLWEGKVFVGTTGRVEGFKYNYGYISYSDIEIADR